MTVRELRDLLSEYDGDAEVRIMSQAAWPFEYSLWSRLWSPDEPADDPEDDRDPFRPYGAPDAGVVYVVEGTQLGYGTARAWEGG